MTRGARRYALRYRLSWLFAVQALVGLGGTSAGIYIAMSYSAAADARQVLMGKATLMRHVFEHESRPLDIAALSHRLDDILIGHDDLRLTITDPEGRALYSSSAPATWSGDYLFTSVDVPWSDGSGVSGRVEIQNDRARSERQLRGLAWTLLCATVLGTLAVATSGFWLVGVGLAPLSDLAQQTRRLRPDAMHDRLSIDGNAEELQPWIEQLNDLLDRVQQAYEQLEAFNADVAHELRTPLATLISRSEVELTRARSNEQLRDSMAHNLEELHRLASIVNDMLFLSHADRGAQARRDAPTSLAAEVAKVVEFHEGELEDCELKVRVEGDAVFAFDRRLLCRAMSNLLSNATRHATAGSTVAVDISTLQSKRVTLSVTNRGPGIAHENLTRVFDRFYRVDAARHTSSEHHGLGLAIVAAIARMHGGSVFAKSAYRVTTIGFTLVSGDQDEVADPPSPPSSEPSATTNP